MSDQFDPEVLEAARTIAARCGAVGQCERCGASWTTDEFTLDDADSVTALIAAARRVIQEDAALDRFDDDGGLKHALGTVIADAAPDKACAH